MFWTLLAASLVVAVVGLPIGDNADTMDALAELTAFQKKFDRGKLEHALLAHASAQGVVQLEDVAQKVRGKGAPKLTVAAGAAPVQPSAGVALEKLERIHALGREGSTLEIGTASGDALALALGWRLSRAEGVQRHELTRIALSDRACTEEDVAREAEVETARKTMLESRSAAATAQKRHEDAEKLSELRRKWKAPWKAIVKADEKRAEMLALRQQAEQKLAEDEARYNALAGQAEARVAELRKDQSGGGEEQPPCVLALATLRQLPSGATVELALPTPIARRAVPVPPLTGVDFPATHAADLWDELKSGSVEQAIAQLEQRFTWHYRHVEVAGIKIGGMTVLQFAPLVLLPLFLGVIRRSRGLSALYNPFDLKPQFDDLPTVGLGTGAMNLLVLTGLPLAACLLCIWSLLEIDQLPIVPLVCAMVSIGLGFMSFTALNDLLELRDAITRSHSNPPPAPSVS